MIWPGKKRTGAVRPFSLGLRVCDPATRTHFVPFHYTRATVLRWRWLSQKVAATFSCKPAQVQLRLRLEFDAKKFTRRSSVVGGRPRRESPFPHPRHARPRNDRDETRRRVHRSRVGKRPGGQRFPPA